MRYGIVSGVNSLTLILLAIFLLSVSVSCSGNVETANTQVPQLLRTDSTERFFNSAPQQNFEMSWSVFSRADIDGNSEIDQNRNHDFYFENDTLYLIINTVSARHYVIYGINLHS